MSDTETLVAAHYTTENLAETIRDGLGALRAKSDADPVELLAAVDEFHMGGRTATEALAEALRVNGDCSVLDVGCGLGGTARYLATRYGCVVDGVDLTAEYVSVGNDLNESLGLSGQITLTRASALDLPMEAARFDRACMLHVGMNIADKDALFGEMARVIRPGGYFGVYDVMRTNDLPLEFPLAWAETADTSFLETVGHYRQALVNAGFEVLQEDNRRELALEFFDALRARLAEGVPPPLGLHLLMGSNAKIKVGNLRSAVENGTIAPVQIIARRP